MNNIVNVSDFRNNISDYINRIIYKNESFLIKKGKSILIKIALYDKNKNLRKEKLAKFSGIWDNKDGAIIERYAKKLRREAKIIP